MNILFICTGNTCRSPMAEGYLSSKRLDNINVSSRGLAADGSPVSNNSILALKETGIDICNHISKQLTAKDIENADKIICLSPSHKNFLLNIGVDENKLCVLGDGISDPYGGDMEIYRRCRDEITAEIDKLINNGFFSDFKIVPFETKHIKSIAELEKICFSEPWSENVITEAFESGTDFIIAEANGKIAGYIGIKSVLDEGYIANIAVCPKNRKKGIGSALIRELLSYAENKKLSFVTLEVRASNNAAISLYSKNGFKEEGKRRGFYRNPTEDAIIMTKRFNNTYENTGN